VFGTVSPLDFGQILEKHRRIDPDCGSNEEQHQRAGDSDRAHWPLLYALAGL